MKKIILKITIIAVLLVFIYATIVNALSFTVTMTPSSTTVPESTEVTVSFKIGNLDVGTNGINVISGYLKYDESIFEKINDSNIDGASGWNPTYGADVGKITLTKGTFVKTEEPIFQLTFKTKAGASTKKGEIHFTNIVASNSETTISASDVTATIMIGTASENVANTTNTTPAPLNVVARPTNNTVNKTNVNTLVNNTSKNNVNNTPVSHYVNSSTNTATGSDIPYTCVEDTIMYIIGAIIVIAIVFYIKFELVNKEIK